MRRFTKKGSRCVNVGIKIIWFLIFKCDFIDVIYDIHFTNAFHIKLLKNILFQMLPIKWKYWKVKPAPNLISTYFIRVIGLFSIFFTTCAKNNVFLNHSFMFCQAGLWRIGVGWGWVKGWFGPKVLGYFVKVYYNRIFYSFIYVFPVHISLVPFYYIVLLAFFRVLKYKTGNIKNFVSWSHTNRFYCRNRIRPHPAKRVIFIDSHIFLRKYCINIVVFYFKKTLWTLALESFFY